MALDWMRVDGALFRHPKVFRLDRALEQERSGWYLLGLWSWLLTYASRGRFAEELSGDVERECGWRGEPGKLVNAMLTVGLLDRYPDGDLGAHDWGQKQGALVEKAEKDSARKRRQRERDRPRDVRVTPSVTVRGTARVRDETVRDETDGTRRDVVASAPPPPAPAPIGITITAPDTPRESWLANDFWRWAQALRAEDGLVPEKPPRNLDTWWSAVMMTLNGEVERACLGFEEFGQDAHWEARNFPFAAFQAQWEKYVPRRTG